MYGTVLPELFCFINPFTLLLTKCGDLDLILDPRTVIDFELSVHDVVRSIIVSIFYGEMMSVSLWTSIVA